MRHFFIFSLVFSSLAAFADPSGGQTLYGESKLQDAVFKAKDESCSLKRFSVATYDLQFLKMFNTMPSTRQSMMAAVTETTDPSCLKNFGVVQFIRGCIYTTSTDRTTGEVEKYYLVRDSHGGEIDFHHPNWEVDSLDIDPLYNSYDQPDANESNRLNWQKYARAPLVLAPDKESLMKDNGIFFVEKNFGYMMNAPQTQKQLFINDTPSGSAWMPNPTGRVAEIETSSLEFMTCIYNIKDVPMTGDPKDFDVAEADGGPIKCFAWSDKVKFNESSQRFDRVTEMDPFCK